jgi:adenylate kinase
VTELAGPTPVNLITGFLGSGKTTLLQHLLRDPALADTAVLINEFGEVGLDHHLLERVDESMVLLRSGEISRPRSRICTPGAKEAGYHSFNGW